MFILIRGAVLAFILLLLGSGCGPSRPTRSPQDQAALVKFEDVRNAETEFFVKHRRYGTLAELIDFRPDAGTGMVVNLKDLDRAMREAVIDKVDHRHLNRDVDFLEGVIPTAENLALAFWHQLETRMPGGRLERLRLVESENNSVEVQAR